MAEIVATGQISIVDLSDAISLSAFITASQNTTQVYDATTQSYSPSYTSTTQILTLNLTKAGSTDSILSGVTGNIKWYRYDGATKTEITSTTNTDGYYLSGTNCNVCNVKTNQNASTGGTRFECSGTYTDPNTKTTTQFSAVIDLNVLTLAKSPLVLNVYGGKGTMFYNNQPASLTVNADLYKGNALSGGNKQFKFFYMDTSVTSTSSTGYDADGGVGWHLCSSSTTGQTPNVDSGVDTTNQGILTVTSAAVTNTQTFKVVCMDNAGGTAGTKTTGIITLLDYTDPISIVIESTGGTIFKNSIGNTILKARLFRKGEELDADGKDSSYLYKWYKYDQSGNIVSDFGGTGINYKTSKTITVNATDITNTGTFRCEVTK